MSESRYLELGTRVRLKSPYASESRTGTVVHCDGPASYPGLEVQLDSQVHGRKLLCCRHEVSVMRDQGDGPAANLAEIQAEPSRGAKVPPDLWSDLDDGIVTVTLDSGMRERMFARRLARFLQHECGHDGAGFPLDEDAREWPGVTSYIVIEKPTAIAFVVTMDSTKWGRFHIPTQKTVRNPGQPVRSVLGWLWVVRDRRREKLATRLIEEVSRVRQFPRRSCPGSCPSRRTANAWPKGMQSTGGFTWTSPDSHGPVSD